MKEKRFKRLAIVPGSFDPITVGHFDVIRTAAEMYDEVYAAVCFNGDKKGIFTIEQRLELLSAACVDIPNVHVEICSGLMSAYMEERKIKYIVKGVRNGSDFDYEYTLSQVMRTFISGIETVILPSKSEYQHISSTYVREILKYDSPVLINAVPENTAELMKKYYNQNNS